MIYKNGSIPIDLICKTHGKILITPGEHLRIGCPLCRNKKEDIWLSELGLPRGKKYRQVRFNINEKLYIVDGYDPRSNTVYLFHGDYWHGNLKTYKPDFINKRMNKTMKQLNDETFKYEESIKNAGFQLVSIWEYDWERL